MNFCPMVNVNGREWWGTVSCSPAARKLIATCAT
jgi:hypothetical protein